MRPKSQGEMQWACSIFLTAQSTPFQVLHLPQQPPQCPSPAPRQLRASPTSPRTPQFQPVSLLQLELESRASRHLASAILTAALEELFDSAEQPFSDWNQPCCWTERTIWLVPNAEKCAIERHRQELRHVARQNCIRAANQVQDQPRQELQCFAPRDSSLSLPVTHQGLRHLFLHDPQRCPWHH
jgi:hypothetical protein